MKGVEPDEGFITIHFDTDEAGLLAGMVDQLAELLTDEDLIATSATGAHEQVSGDPFARWEAEFVQDAEPTVENLEQAGELDEMDPVIKRLFPDAYPDDPAASHDFRRFTHAQQRSQKVADANLVIYDLQRTDRRGRCRVPADHVTPWLKTLTNVRLALAARLDITDEVSADEAAQLPESDPRSWMYEVYAWTGWLQECVIEAL
ncbi:DUF2017 domain-containing protein [Luteococcus japonicus]|uniref:DUF2017 domain-containing protein n=1 Tax=Luteococcus japonicus LSP_Lj1 TaxID=1255658 RepID=A0A1R4JCM2_9ACTN|nr:DUF2017 domain-containing protein [Luteococcus japonicus]SJN29782.1 DUF2017 domain-containing protein [Luteococcus japonicus LSP_Lj1]